MSGRLKFGSIIVVGSKTKKNPINMKVANAPDRPGAGLQQDGQVPFGIAAAKRLYDVRARLVEECGIGAIATINGRLAWSLSCPDGEGAPWAAVLVRDGADRARRHCTCPRFFFRLL